MASKSKKPVETIDFRHDSAKRTNIPPAKIAGEGKVPDIGKQKYAYSPHLSPVLRFDPEARADKVREVVEKACSGKSLTAEEKEILRAVGTHWEHPSLEWAGKKEEHDRHWCTVEPVALHIHERVSANAILSAAKRKDVERSLFADPELEYQEAVQFYKHDMDWTNRIILGDSLEVMSSLARREELAGKVQMIYMDPPYGIKFKSNFQSEVGKLHVGDRDSDLTREPEMVKAYRDTWELGIHSYLSYLRDRLLVIKELLAPSGSLFVQISFKNLHHVREILDDVLGPDCFRSIIVFTKGGGGLRSVHRLTSRTDYLIWYCADPDQAVYNQLYDSGSTSADDDSGWLLEPTGAYSRRTTAEKSNGALLASSCRLFSDEDLSKPGPGSKYDVQAFGRTLNSGSRWWGMPPESLNRLIEAERAFIVGSRLRYKRFSDESVGRALDNVWLGMGGAPDPVYVVQTNTEVIKRCIMMTTSPGDLVLDPTCGGGTTAVVAEQFGRRWITIDASRVALSLARQRILTRMYPSYRLESGGCAHPNTAVTEKVDPSVGFCYKSINKVTASQIGNNHELDTIGKAHADALNERLHQINERLSAVSPELRVVLTEKLASNLQHGGVRSSTDADRRRWLLPGTTKDQIAAAFAGKSKLKAKHVREHAEMVPPDGKFEHWDVPFDTDPDWPESLSNAVADYREAWRAKMDEMEASIAAHAQPVQLIHKPEVVSGVVRVTGPFTVEGVMPEELTIGAAGLFDGTPNEDLDHAEIGEERVVEMQNLHAYLSSMVSHLKSDGVTFPDNKNPKFARLESLFDSDSGSTLHAEGVWEGDDVDGPARIGVGFGPQYGPVSAKQVEGLIREASRRGYDEMVVAGFSFDAEAHAIIHEDPNPKVRVHMAQIRPDLNAGMDGLLKDTPSSQLFTVFGAPAIEVGRDGDEYTVTLEGVDIYDPVKNTVRSTGATKVEAWFLDSDYDGRTFCITQAFFPDQDAWGKLAKALKDVVDPEAFAAFKGTTSLPFSAGEHGQIAVKVIDPRGNEVMTIHQLES